MGDSNNAEPVDTSTRVRDLHASLVVMRLQMDRQSQPASFKSMKRSRALSLLTFLGPSGF
jgi:hypothetical protein